jgi:hypothetical protein
MSGHPDDTAVSDEEATENLQEDETGGGEALLDVNNVGAAGVDYNNNNNNRREALPIEHEDEFEVTIDDIRDGIVSAGTQQAYTCDICHFLQWVASEQNDWLTEYGNRSLADIFVQGENETRACLEPDRSSN